jgi:hypothetical protein
VASRANITKVGSIIDGLFASLKLKFLPTGKTLEWHTSLPAVYRASVAAHGGTPDAETENHLLEIADAYLEGIKARIKARALNAALGNETAETAGGEAVAQTPATIIESATHEIETVLDSETQNARSLGAVEGISQVAASQGVADPTVFFVVVRDSSLCDECKDIHLMPTGVEPRLWKLSEVMNGYHQRGVDAPSMTGLHPHCRCSLTYLAPGFGFNARGYVQYVAPGFDALEDQRRES